MQEVGIYDEKGRVYARNFFRGYLEDIEKEMIAKYQDNFILSPKIQELNSELYYKGLKKEFFDENILTGHNMLKIEVPSLKDKKHENFFEIIIKDLIDKNKEKIKENLVLIVNKS